MDNFILLSFDLEEFDAPEEYGQVLEEKVKFEVSFAGLKSVISLLDKLDIRVTFFVTANFALNYPAMIKELAQKHEIASHGFYHSQFAIADLQKSKQALEAITEQAILGFRMARLQAIDETAIGDAGYVYNSSMNPTYLPGRYNNFFKPRTAYYANQILNIPVSVTPLIRFPLFWLSFKNFPLAWIKLASKFTLKTDNYLSLYFHPWEFTNLASFQLPGYVKRHSGRAMIQRLEQYLIWLKQQGEFISFLELVNKLDQRQLNVN